MDIVGCFAYQNKYNYVPAAPKPTNKGMLCICNEVILND